MYLIELVKHAADKAKNDCKDAALARRKWKLAKQFNKLYTYGGTYFEPTKILPGTAIFGLLPDDVAAWMCPTCNKIHRAVSCSAFSGLQFPACCGFREGHRLGDAYATVT